MVRAAGGWVSGWVGDSGGGWVIVVVGARVTCHQLMLAPAVAGLGAIPHAALDRGEGNTCGDLLQWDAERVFQELLAPFERVKSVGLVARLKPESGVGDAQLGSRAVQGDVTHHKPGRLPRLERPRRGLVERVRGPAWRLRPCLLEQLAAPASWGRTPTANAAIVVVATAGGGAKEGFGSAVPDRGDNTPGTDDVAVKEDDPARRLTGWVAEDLCHGAPHEDSTAAGLDGLDHGQGRLLRTTLRVCFTQLLPPAKHGLSRVGKQSTPPPPPTTTTTTTTTKQWR